MKCMASWNPWHGCHKISAGCQNCYVYRMDAKHGRDSTVVTRLKNFDFPICKKRDQTYKIGAGEVVYTCFTSDFFVEEADEWRKEAWKMMRERSDISFYMITKRIDRFDTCIPEDWGEGYENVTICCTVENQDQANIRLPQYKKAKIVHKELICEPLLGKINLQEWLDDSIEQLTAGGESGVEARICDYDWIMHLREQCIEKNVRFFFKQTGARFRKNGKVYRIMRKDQHKQAAKAEIDVRAQYPTYK